VRRIGVTKITRAVAMTAPGVTQITAVVTAP
jgi:hypothetical protein